MAGDGDFYFTVPPNTTGQSRQAVVTMDLRPLTIVQNAR